MIINLFIYLRMRWNSLKVHKAAHLVELGCLVGEVAGEEEHIAGLHLPRKPHEEKRIHAQSCK